LAAAAFFAGAWPFAAATATHKTSNIFREKDFMAMEFIVSARPAGPGALSRQPLAVGRHATRRTGPARGEPTAVGRWPTAGLQGTNALDRLVGSIQNTFIFFVVGYAGT
jgi:hypothetical protein